MLQSLYKQGLVDLAGEIRKASLSKLTGELGSQG